MYIIYMYGHVHTWVYMVIYVAMSGHTYSCMGKYTAKYVHTWLYMAIKALVIYNTKFGDVLETQRSLEIWIPFMYANVHVDFRFDIKHVRKRPRLMQNHNV